MVSFYVLPRSPSLEVDMSRSDSDLIAVLVVLGLLGSAFLIRGMPEAATITGFAGAYFCGIAAERHKREK